MTIGPCIGRCSSCIDCCKGDCRSAASITYYLACRLVNLSCRIDCYRKSFCWPVTGHSTTSEMRGNDDCCYYRRCSCIYSCERGYISAACCCQSDADITIGPGKGRCSSCIGCCKGDCRSAASITYNLARRLINFSRRIDCYRKGLCRPVAGHSAISEMWGNDDRCYYRRCSCIDSCERGDISTACCGQSY